MYKKLAQLIEDSKPFFSKDWLDVNRVFFDMYYIAMFSKRLMHFYEFGITDELPLPHFSEEVTPHLTYSFSFYKDVIAILKQDDFMVNDHNKQMVSEAIQNTPFEHILLIMGQRQTPATIKTAEGLPLKMEVLYESCLKPHNNQISVGVRAWEKHVDRTENLFWGKPEGTPQQKENQLKTILTNVIEHHTWWNTFYHYKHEVVFEIRVESGHGIRWSYNDQSLIGFLEPFL